MQQKDVKNSENYWIKKIINKIYIDWVFGICICGAYRYHIMKSRSVLLIGANHNKND